MITLNTSVHDIQIDVDNALRNNHLTLHNLADAIECEQQGQNRISVIKFLRSRHNQMAKSLKTIDGKAAEIEVIEIEDTLEDCSERITDAITRIETAYTNFDNGAKYNRASIGLNLLKARHLHLLPNDSSRGMGRKKKESLTNGGSDSNGGFLEWLKSEHPQIKQASAYNLMNLAQNAGLTIESTEKDITALKKTKALHGTPLKQLYTRNTNDEIEEQPDPEPEQPAPKYSLIRDTLTGTRKECQLLLDLKDDMTPAAHETACARLVRTLEELTGSKWGPVDDEHAAHYTEHPEAYELGS